MYLIAALLVAAATTYAYVGLRWCALDRHPLPIYALLLLCAVLALLHLRNSGHLAVRLAALVPLLYTAVFVFALAVLHDYGAGRPAGPGVGSAFPRLELADATSGGLVAAGAAAPGGLQLIVLFRGFW